MAAQVKVRVYGLGVLPPRLNGGSVCDESAAEGGMRKYGAIIIIIIIIIVYYATQAAHSYIHKTLKP